MKNYIQAGNVITATAPAGGIASSEGMVMGTLFGVAATAAPEGQPVEIATTGVFALAKASATTFTSGALVSFDASTRQCVAPGTGKYPIGAATAAAGNGEATVTVRLNGTTTAAA